MKKIILLCAGGMSTSMLVKNMQKAAADEGFECEIAAYPQADLTTPTAFFSDRRFVLQKRKSPRLARACRLTLST